MGKTIALTREVLVSVLDQKFTEFEVRMENRIDHKFNEFEIKMDKKMDKRFAEFEVKIDKKIEAKFSNQETRLKSFIDQAILDLRKDISSEIDSKVKPALRESENRVIFAIAELINDGILPQIDKLQQEFNAFRLRYTMI